MGTLLRGSEVSGMYLGSNEISEMYLGSNLFYSSEYIMGVEWDKQADPAMTRIGASKNFVANIGIGSEVVLNFTSERQTMRTSSDWKYPQKKSKGLICLMFFGILKTTKSWIIFTTERT